MHHRSTILVTLLAACGSGEPQPTRYLVVDEPFTLCALGSSLADLAFVHATQWQLEIPAGEIALPHSTEPSYTPAAPREPIALELALRNIAGEDIIAARDVDALIIDDPERDPDTLFVEVDLPQQPIQGAWWLRLWVDAPAHEDFGLSAPPWPVGVSTAAGYVTGSDATVARGFGACDPGGPTSTIRVRLDRGEISLDLHVEAVPNDVGPDVVVLVGADLEIDDLPATQHDYFNLFAIASDATGNAGDFAVLVPDALGDLGCGVTLLDLQTASQHAAIVDCELGELEPLEIVGVTLEG